MRSIGKESTSLVQRITKEELQNGYDNIVTRIIEKIPLKIFETWEGARSEIENIIEDTIYEI